MKAKLVRIGNSRGVRLPKAVIGQCALGDIVELHVRDGAVVIRPVPRRPREGWEAAFAAMAEAGEDPPLDMPAGDWDRQEWT
jgi:antitoxin MazE